MTRNIVAALVGSRELTCLKRTNETAGSRHVLPRLVRKTKRHSTALRSENEEFPFISSWVGIASVT